GWAMDAAMTSRFVVDALEMAVRRRLPGAGLVAHSDRGSQYASDHYRSPLSRHGITCSMSRVDPRARYTVGAHLEAAADGGSTQPTRRVSRPPPAETPPGAGAAMAGRLS